MSAAPSRSIAERKTPLSFPFNWSLIHRLGVNDCVFRSAMLRDGAALIQRRGKSALIPFTTILQRPAPTTLSTQNAPEESDARVRRRIARQRKGVPF
jgi:hypothetical protein